MNHLFIRTYEKDDYLARLCYESWLLAGFTGKVYFYTEKYDYKWIKGQGNIIEREYCNNFGGQLGANALMDGFRKIDFNDNDLLISCDADVIIKENPLENFDADFGGKGGMNEHGFNHISGQLMIFKGRLMKYILKDDAAYIYSCWNEMVRKGINVADDIYTSYRINKFPGALEIVNMDKMWVHDKPYHHEPRTDWQNIVNETKLK